MWPAMAAKYDWEQAEQGGIHTAFLHAKIDATIFITLPERCNDLAGPTAGGYEK